MTEFKQEHLDAIRDAMNMVLIRARRDSGHLFKREDVEQILIANGLASKPEEESKVTEVDE